MLFRVITLISGLLFGLGMMISGMVSPARVVGFLDFTGHWDPSLAFVMGGALAVFMPCYFFLIKPKSRAICGADFRLSKNSKVDTKLMIGSALFGAGWGLAGICPGPAITSLASVQLNVVWFVVAMAFGIWFGCQVDALINSKQKRKAVA